MNRALFLPVVALVLVLGEVACTPPQTSVYSAGFSFSKYDFCVFSKPESGTSTALFGLDVEIANLMARYNMTIIGDKEIAGQKAEDKARTLFVRFAVSTFNAGKGTLITVSFDDAVSGKTVASLTSQSKGSLYEPKNRTKALEAVAKPLSEALTREKGLTIEKAKK